MRAFNIALMLLFAGLTIDARAAVTKTQLAGFALGEYPYFEYVRNAHRMTPPAVAIDPTRFPGIVGQTCDTYVVNHKTPAGWAADPSLLDLTPGGAMTRTFVGGTIQMNTFSVVPTLVLTDDAGPNVGVPYDIVLDCNRNGLLDGDDYIDGLGNEAGFYMVHDIAHHGPYTATSLSYNLPAAAAAAYGIAPQYRAERVYYPTNIEALGALPVVIISHANAFSINDYEYLGRHLASWGYIVMVHSTNTARGPAAAAATTLRHTDAFLEQAMLGTIVHGALVGHIHPKKLAWVGHGRGGEGVVLAYHALYTGAYLPTNYARKYIRLLDSMAPTDFNWSDGAGGPGIAQPHDANYHLWAPAGEWDVSGDPSDPVRQSQPIADRATRYKVVTTIHGMRSSQFAETINTPAIAGPWPLFTDSAHLAVNGYMVALLKYFVEGQLPPLDYLTHQQEVMYPHGIDPPPITEVQNEFRNGSTAGRYVIDDYQSAPSTALSSSGTLVDFTVTNLREGLLDDNDVTFTWTATDPFNGAIFATPPDTSRGVTFDWKGRDRFYQWEFTSRGMDVSAYSHLAFRGAQATQHPNTIAAIGDLTFQVELRDVAGHTSAINIGASGAGLEEPYQRSGGWFDEMETVRLRLTDFQNNGSGLDLTHIVSVRFNVGPSYGDARGRVVIDDVMLVNDGLP